MKLLIHKAEQRRVKTEEWSHLQVESIHALAHRLPSIIYAKADRLYFITQIMLEGVCDCSIIVNQHGDLKEKKSKKSPAKRVDLQFGTHQDGRYPRLFHPLKFSLFSWWIRWLKSYVETAYCKATVFGLVLRQPGLLCALWEERGQLNRPGQKKLGQCFKQTCSPVVQQPWMVCGLKQRKWKPGWM